MIVVVGGQTRKAGKTTAMCNIIRATVEAAWVAVKISPHRHNQPEGGRQTDTDKYLAAGAREAHLLTPSDPLPAARHLIVESNSPPEWLRPDLVVFVSAGSAEEWKPSARAIHESADYVLIGGGIPPELLAAIHERIAAE